MSTRIDVTADPVRDRCLLTTDHLSPRRLPSSPGVVRVALVAAGALLLAGDEVRIEVVAEGPVRVEIVETAGTVAYAMRGGAARWDVDIRLTDGASLHWYAEPFVVSAGADVTRTTTAHLARGCTAQLRESLVLGRYGEVGGTLRTATRAWIDDDLLLAEDLDLSPETRSGWAILGAARCLDTVTTLGFRLPDTPHTLQLEGPGSVARQLVQKQHESDLIRTPV
ncbi:urease accessory protein UreD [Kribbella jiaozuonensis]|uniref:Urease accessory protein UreD n=1 Tax=Kribbella jiaozuonensis TaxID=2575441 RepID=A0A4U3LXX6_9ACTN|nr:urease accessory protein UreD [Kribbella jiaozuonensis]TKK80234.1 urease accessory protein UreD [Kribbella jiaozuonensis]